MKKIFIIVITLALLFCFTSCEKDKSEDMIDTYVKFATAYETFNLTRSMLDEESPDISSLEEVTPSAIEKLIKATKGKEIKVTEVTSKAGAIKIEDKGEDNGSTKYTGIKIAYKYTEGTDTTAKTGELTVEGSYEQTTKATKKVEFSKTYTYDVDLTIDGNPYKIKYAETSEHKFTLASVNGTNVELKLINAAMSAQGY